MPVSLTLLQNIYSNITCGAQVEYLFQPQLRYSGHGSGVAVLQVFTGLAGTCRYVVILSPAPFLDTQTPRTKGSDSATLLRPPERYETIYGGIGATEETR